MTIDLDGPHLLDARTPDLGITPTADLGATIAPTRSLSPSTPPVLIDARTGEPWVPPTARPLPPATLAASGPSWRADVLLLVVALVAPVLLVALAAQLQNSRVGGMVLAVGLVALSGVYNDVQRRRDLHRPVEEDG